MPNRLAIKVWNERWSDRVHLLVAEMPPRQHDDWRYGHIEPLLVGTAVQMMVPKPGEEAAPTVTLDGHAAKDLMTELWSAGIRPDGYADYEARYITALERLTQPK